MATQQIGKRVRKIASGQTALAASSQGAIATVAPNAGECIGFWYRVTAKSVNFNVPNEAGGIPADETLRLGLRRKTTGDDHQLAYANGLEPVTVDWIIFGITP